MTAIKSLLSRSFTRFEAVLGLLACLSVVLVTLPSDFISRRFVLDPRDYPAHIDGDRYSGGQSEASWVNKAQRIWLCKLSTAIGTPYCSYQIGTINESWSGLNLSQYTKMTVYGKYQGDSEFIRIYLRNRHLSYYVIGDDTTTKYNQVEVPIADLEQGISFRMADFQVADWWVTSKRIPLEMAGPEFNDIIFIEFQTGSQLQSGDHQIQIEKIVWQGPYLSDEMLYRSIALAWAIAIFLLLFARLTRLKVQLKHTRNYQKELESINKLLNLQNKQFEDLAKTDHLTGLLNRIGIREPLLEGLRRWKSAQTPMSFILTDIDHFKTVNDTLGHDVGDKILKETAKVLKDKARSSDYVARWGGEEFLLVLPDTGLKQAAELAEAMRSRLEQTPFHKETRITASFGVATLNEADLDSLFKAADTALYEAKQSGRNKVCTKG